MIRPASPQKSRFIDASPAPLIWRSEARATSRKYRTILGARFTPVKVSHAVVRPWGRVHFDCKTQQRILRMDSPNESRLLLVQSHLHAPTPWLTFDVFISVTINSYHIRIIATITVCWENARSAQSHFVKHWNCRCHLNCHFYFRSWNDSFRKQWIQPWSIFTRSETRKKHILVNNTILSGNYFKKMLDKLP